MPKHDISLTLDFSAGDRVTHTRFGDGVVMRCVIEIWPKNKADIQYVVSFTRDSEFLVIKRCASRELRLQATE